MPPAARNDTGSHPRVGGDSHGVLSSTWPLYFYSRPRKEGDLTGGGAAPRQRDFYSRPRMGGDISA